MIQRFLMERQVGAVHIMGHINILDILLNIGAFQLIIFQIRRSHDHNVRLHLHHQHNHSILPDIIRLKLIAFHLEDFILRIACNIVDHDIGSSDNLFYNIFIIFVEAVFFRNRIPPFYRAVSETSYNPPFPYPGKDSFCPLSVWRP